MTQTKEIPADQLKEIKDNFEFFDRDNNGEITVKEFIELLKVISPDSSPEQAEKGFALIDENQDGHIDLGEFIEWWQTCWWEF